MLDYLIMAIAIASPAAPDRAYPPPVRVTITSAGDRVAYIRTADLDLGIARDRDALTSRVAVAATRICREVDPELMYQMLERRCRLRVIKAGDARMADLLAKPQRQLASFSLVAPRS